MYAHPHRGPPGRGLLLIALLVLARTASAQDTEPTSRDDAAPAAPSSEAPEPDSRNGPTAPEPAPGEPDAFVLPTTLGEVELGGRLDVRETLERPEGGIWAGELTVPAARLEASYRWKKRLRAVVEFDVNSGLKDAFIWLKLGHGVATRAGHFKIPLSLVELESTTRLPVARRGLLRDVLNDALGLSGRSNGAQVEWKCSGCFGNVKLLAGVWQTQDPDTKVALERGLGLEPGVRGTWELGDVELGASGLLQPAGASPGGVEQSWLAALDVRHTLRLSGGTLRTWAEGLTGRAALLGGTGNVLMGRVISAWRLGGLERGKAYVEPFVMLSAVDPDLDARDDLMWEGVGGLNAGQWQRWRVQAQFEVRKASAGTPPVLEALEESLASRRAVLVQLEVGF